jgi:hypothetical protein
LFAAAIRDEVEAESNLQNANKDSADVYDEQGSSGPGSSPEAAGADVVILFGGPGAPPVVVASWEAWSRAVQMTTMPDDRAAV